MKYYTENSTAVFSKLKSISIAELVNVCWNVNMEKKKMTALQNEGLAKLCKGTAKQLRAPNRKEKISARLERSSAVSLSKTEELVIVSPGGEALCFSS